MRRRLERHPSGMATPVRTRLGARGFTRTFLLLWLVAGAAAAQNIDVVGPSEARGRFGVGGGASITLLPQVTFRPTVDLSWSKSFASGWGLGARVSTLGTFNTFALSGRRRLLSATGLQVAARLELFGEVSMGAGDRVAVDPFTQWMRPLLGVAPGVGIDFGDRAADGSSAPLRRARWSLTLDIPLALPGLTGVAMPGTFYGTSWAQPFLRPGVASEDFIFGEVSFHSTIQVLLGPRTVAPIVSIGLGF